MQSQCFASYTRSKSQPALIMFLQVVGDVLVDAVKPKEQIRSKPATPIIKPYKKWLTEYQVDLIIRI